jgi:phosphoribosylamine--glycine ligase
MAKTLQNAALPKRAVLVVGAGAREHALAWKLAQSPRVSRLVVAPGNDGMPEAWERWPVSLKKEDLPSLAERAKAEGIDLVVVGPDNPLADGLVDELHRVGVLTFGPTAAAARIEASKIFAKEVMSAAGVPTAKYFTVSSLAEATRVLSALPWPPQMGHGWVIKADGLALGKGVVVCRSKDEAVHAVEALLPISGRVLIEECVKGEELSWMAFCDGAGCALLEPARDYKRIGDDDQGPNTGGMGAFSPVPQVHGAGDLAYDEWADRVRERVFEPVLREMTKRGAPFQGLLYAGLMVDFTKRKFWVLEFNARFGDPETQVLMPRIEGDVLDWFEAAASGDLSSLPKQIPFKKEAAVYVVAAAAGYPENPEKGQNISGVIPGAEGFFFAGVRRAGEALETSGGRVLGALGTGGSIDEARLDAYLRISKVHFEGLQRRSDIAKYPGGRPLQGPQSEGPGDGPGEDWSTDS